MGKSPKEGAVTRSKLSTKTVLLAAGIGLSATTFSGSQPAAAESVGYYGYYYGDPYGAYGSVKRWGAPRYRHRFGHGFGHGVGDVDRSKGSADAHFGRDGFGHNGGGGHR